MITECWLEGTAGGLCSILFLEMELLPGSRLGQLWCCLCNAWKSPRTELTQSARETVVYDSLCLKKQNTNLFLISSTSFPSCSLGILPIVLLSGTTKKI